MKQKKKAVYLPLTHALAWIVASTFLISGGSFAFFKQTLKHKRQSAGDPSQYIRSIVQTGPKKEALKTEYLAELIGLSADCPPHARSFNLSRAAQRLKSSPLISRADVKLIKPGTLYIDYTVRQPIAWLEDYQNTVLDKEAFPFPFSPFFSPKNLPSLYLGLAPFGAPSIDPDRPTALWGQPLAGKYIALALDVLALVTDPQVADLFSVKRIDVSNAFAESYGTREIVLITEDTLIKNREGRSIEFRLPRILRLSTKNYAQQLGNYLKLREQLFDAEIEATHALGTPGAPVRLPEKIIDFRIQKLAFINERGSQRT
jgi:acyl-CoA synthetase (AMP-forming)/AMP-acid ligase II